MRRHSLMAASAAGLLALTPALVAQQAPPATTTQAVVLKGKAPVSNEVLKVKLPRPAEGELSNGAHLMVLEDHRAPQVTFSITMPGGGGYFDPADTIGLASATAALMREGTTSRTSAQMSEQLETMAATVNAGAGLTSIDATLSGSSLTENFEATLAIAADVLLHPTFAEDEIARYKQRTKTSLLQQRSSPNFLGSELLQRLVYGNHPASRISPTAEGVDRMTRDAMVQWHKTRYVPDRALIAMSGDITLAAAKRALETALVDWKKTSSPAVTIAEPPAMGPGRVSFISRPGSVQTTLMVGTQAISRVDPEYDAFQVMNKVLGGGPRAALHAPARREGLHLRREQRPHGRSLEGRLDRGDGRAHRGHRAGHERSDGRDRAHARRADSAEGFRQRTPVAHRAVCARARVAGSGARQLPHDLLEQAAAELLGHVPDARECGDPGAGPGGGEEVSRPVAAADHRGG
jgi:hypothetical protein